MGAFEFPGYSLSNCPTTSFGCEDANMAAYKYLTETVGIHHSKIIFFGLSLGTGPTCQVAAQVPSAGVILQSPFMSAYSVQLGDAAQCWLFALCDIFQSYRAVP